MIDQPLSKALFEQAKSILPGGVNSPVRAFHAVGGTPLFISKASGPYVFDVDEHQFIDLVGSWGPMILGHSHPQVIKAICQQAQLGTSYGAPTKLETELAELICHAVPSCQQLRLVNSGTEATMTAIRIARGCTGREQIVKFAGHYHGHHDALLVDAGSGNLTLGTPSSLGVPVCLAQLTHVWNFNDLDQLEQRFSAVGNQLAAVIVEPIAGNMNMIPADPKWLQRLRQLCDQYHVVLIFDEVMTGFRVALGGAQSIYAIDPDLCTLGKVIGGGLPLAAVGGKKELMQQLAPVGLIYQAGTLSGNPLAVTAGIATLKLLMQNPDCFQSLDRFNHDWCQGLIDLAKHYHIALSARSIGGMFGIFLTEKTPHDLLGVKEATKLPFSVFFHAMLDHGLYLAPSNFEAGFLSLAHVELNLLKPMLSQADLALADCATWLKRQT